MTTTTLQARVDDFLAQKRIAVAGVSRNDRQHPVGKVCEQRGRRQVANHPQSAHPQGHGHRLDGIKQSIQETVGQGGLCFGSGDGNASGRAERPSLRGT